MFPIAGWTTPIQLLKEELIQLEYEGYLIPEEIREQVEMIDPDHDAYSDSIPGIYRQLEHLQKRPDYDWVEPNGLEEIRALRPQGVRKLELTLSDEDLKKRFHGAWRGRSVGCALGKPVEAKRRKPIKEFLIARNAWELTDYVPNDPPFTWCPLSTRENIAFMEPDDDIHYTLMGLVVLEKFGPDFRWNDIANSWNTHLPYYAICTAERQAILNYNMRGQRHGTQPSVVTPAFTRRFNNPYREWIGAQIRADGWAYACAGNPELAAEFAWRDAHWTHTRNGIYGEMFFAAVIAAAFVEQDPYKLIEIGLSEIPERCKLAVAIREALEWKKQCPSWEDFMDRLDEKYENMSGVHTVNNALIVLMALLYGELDLDRSCALAVMAGLDTDCNGATVGSIVGIINDSSRLAEKLHDTIKPNFIGETEVTMTALAARTLAVWKRVNGR